MLDLTTIPMRESRLRWRFTDPRGRVLPEIHLAQIHPLDEASAERLLKLSDHWYDEQPFSRGAFADIITTSLSGQGDVDGSRLVRKWLYQRGIPFTHRVLLSWSGTEAAITNWKMVVKYWEDLWTPGADDLAVFDESLSWALFFWHEEEAFFCTRPAPTAGCV